MKDSNKIETLVLAFNAIKKNIAILDKERKTAGLGSCRDTVTSGDHDLFATMTISAGVKVGKDHPTRIVQKARPWALFTATLASANKALAAAGAVGIDLTTVVAAAEALDAKEIKKAREETETKVAALKEATKGIGKGKVTVSAVTVSVKASGPEYVTAMTPDGEECLIEV